jgi:hypothetical protein
MTQQPLPAFGDRVRIRSTSVTREAGIAGLEGDVHGESVPSASSVEVIGPAPDDFVVNVYVDERGEGYWLAPEHVEFIDHNPGKEIRLDGVPKRWVRRADGTWNEIADGEVENAEPQGEKPGPWKRLWNWMQP